MFKELEQKAREMIASGEDELCLTMAVDGYYVSAIINVSAPEVDANEQA